MIMSTEISFFYHMSGLRSKISNLNITLNSNIFVLKKILKVKKLYNEIDDILNHIFLIEKSFYDYDFFVELYDILKNIETEPLKQDGIRLDIFKEYNCKTIHLVCGELIEEINIYTGQLVKIKLKNQEDPYQEEMQFCHHVSKNKTEMLEFIASSLVVFYSVFKSYLDFIVPSTFKIMTNSLGGKKNEISN